MLNPQIHFSNEVRQARAAGLPLVSLESTVITHGLPMPQNLELGRAMEERVRAEGAVPATIALIEGQIHVGITDAELQRLAAASNLLKVSLRDFATAAVKKVDGGTTVAGTMFGAQQAGIRLLATGGIGGVHRESYLDISTDLQALATIPMIVVCAGAKSILDLPATLEYLETMGVPVVGYGTDEFPAFFSRKSGLKVSVRLDSPQEIADFAAAHWGLGLQSAILVTNPIPEAFALDDEFISPVIAQASADAQAQGIHGQALTPFLLARINELSGGKSLQANLALLHHNATLAARIAKAMTAG